MYTLYADESGHTGADYLDKHQPVFVMAGWLVAPSSRAALDAAVARTTGGKAEVKYGKAVKTTQGQAQIARILDDATAAGCIPIVNAWDKRYGVATRMVDSFCDWDHNLVARQAVPVDAGDLRKKLADFIHKRFPDDALELFARAFREADRAGLGEAQKRTVLLFELSGQAGAGQVFGACDVDSLHEDIRDPLPGEQTVSDPHLAAIEAKHNRTVYLPAFYGFIHSADGKLEELGGDGEVVYDQQVEFSKPFLGSFSVLARAERRAPVRISQDQEVMMGILRLKQFTMADSATTPGIQAADALAAAIRYSASNPETLAPGQPLHEPMKALFAIGNGQPSPLYRTVQVTFGPQRLKEVFSPLFAMTAAGTRT